MDKVKAYVAGWKKKEVKELARLMKEYKTICLSDITGLPSPQLQDIKSKLRDKMLIRIVKGSLVRLALEECKEKQNLDKLKEHIKGITALVFSNEEPFILSKILLKNKSPAPAKIGSIVPIDVIVQAGPTQFTPGPIIGELGSVGLKTGVEGGKIVIKENKVLLKKGETVNAKIFDILNKLKIEPMEVSLNLNAVYDNGNVYFGDVLRIDENDYINNIKLAYNESFNLAVYINYLTKETVNYLLQKAEREALALQSNVKKVEIKDIKIEQPAEEKKQEIKIEEVKEIPKIEDKKEALERVQQKVEIKEEKKPAENIVDELVSKARTEGLKPKYAKLEAQKRFSEKDIKKAEEFYKELVEKEIGQEKKKEEVQSKEDLKKKKEKEDKAFKEAEKKAQEILRKL